VSHCTQTAVFGSLPYGTARETSNHIGFALSSRTGSVHFQGIIAHFWILSLVSIRNIACAAFPGAGRLILCVVSILFTVNPFERVLLCNIRWLGASISASERERDAVLITDAFSADENEASRPISRQWLPSRRAGRSSQGKSSSSWPHGLRSRAGMQRHSTGTDRGHVGAATKILPHSLHNARGQRRVPE
jgi:hypothetical protein